MEENDDEMMILMKNNDNFMFQSCAAPRPRLPAAGGRPLHAYQARTAWRIEDRDIGGVVAQLLTEYGGNIIVIIFLVVSFVCMCLRVVFINIPYFYYLFFISKCVPSYSIEWCTYVGIMTHSKSPGLWDQCQCAQ